MIIRFASQPEITNWNNLILSNPDGGNITQGYELASLKLKTGWKIQFAMADLCAITIHERKIPILGKLWYIPKGPGVSTPEQLAPLLKPLREFASQNGVFVIKIEPEIIKNDENLKQISKLGIYPTRPIQPNFSTVILDVSKDTDEIMTNLPQKGRHAINRAKRDGVVTKMVEPNDKNFQIMVDLMHQTMADKSVMIRDTSYYKNYWETYADAGLGALFFAYNGKTPIAGAFVLTFGDKATYKDGGSVREKTIYGASHALQWKIIEWLHAKGIKTYDLCGTPPSAEIDNKNHPHYGIGLFKTSFNKIVIDYVGAYDIAVHPLTYKFWAKIGERIVYRYFSIFLKKMFY